ncbi:uncharacterized protein DNG_09520 [Cephalotrichum gorgonifer]|uniref:Heterokaryon incompatibility domain-containing protein n=1 Tax=Cephalotrichum gorgonifer TaxID=2041049 RepID=A0AAE8SZD4_9PEZI|nr:uncharacterized protein DNG_09520 [Cephalotrichum gorgonifer]
MSTPSSPHEAYAPLSDGSSIRLLRRLNRNQPGPMRFSIEHHNLSDPDLAYHCLSYTWGNPFAHGRGFSEFYDEVSPLYRPDRTVPIIVDERPMRVSKNLYDALATLPESAYLDYTNRPTRNRGQTVVHGAAAKGRCSLLLRHVKCGADLNAVDDGGKTPLHHAAANGFDDCVELLCKTGALREAKDKDGQTAEDLAVSAGHESTVLLLQEWMSRPDPEPSSIPLEEDGPEKLIWIDAICINQSDLDEKGIQVRMMNTIYSRASFVIGWLGPEDSHTEDGVRALNTLAAHLPQFQKSSIEPFSGSGANHYSDAGIPPISRSEWDGLASIYQRQWFRRTWIVQEAVLPVVLIIYCGKHMLSIHELGTVAQSLRVAEALGGTRKGTNYTLPGEIAVSVEWNMAEVFKWREKMYWAYRAETEEERRGYREGFTLARLVGDFRTFLASDVRDKIFSLDGILNAFTEGGQGNGINGVDYHMDVATVYTAATRRIIQEEGNLGILTSGAGNQPEKSGEQARLPSWAPNFAVPGVGAAPGFSADGGIAFPGPRDSVPNSSLLGIKGLRVGRIRQAGGRVSTAPGGIMMFDPSHLKLVLSLRDTARQPGAEKPVLTEILWRTLCMNTSTGAFFDSSQFGPVAPDDMGNQFTIFMALMLLAGADQKVLESVGLSADQTREMHTIIHKPACNPWKESLASALDHLDALVEYDGEKCLAPTRQEILMLWDNLKYTLMRTTPARADGSPLEFSVPPAVADGTDRIVGRGVVNGDSPVYMKCRGFGSSYLMAYGGRQLVTIFDADVGFLGLAPVAAKKGDEIWILPGLNAPAVLRRVADGADHGDVAADDLEGLSLNENVVRYSFVGIAYVHGIMNGEAIESREGELRDIDLV